MSLQLIEPKIQTINQSTKLSVLTNKEMKVLTVKISKIDYDLILHIKKLREAKGWSQRILSEKMGLSLTFVGKVESLGQPEKYSIRHLNLLMKAFGFKNINQLFPKELSNEDMVTIYYNKVPALKNDGTPSKLYEERIIEIKSFIENK